MESGEGRYSTVIDSSEVARPSWHRLGWMWTAISLKSFGGGTAVQLYAYRELVESRRWLSAERWAEAYGLCRLVPGINLIALALLTGADLDGIPGAVASMIGLLIPSVLVTLVIAVVYTKVATLAVVQAAFRGVITAAAGMSIAVGWRLVSPVLRTGWGEAWYMVVAPIGIAIGCTILVVMTSLPVYALILGAAVVMGVLLTFHERDGRGNKA
jgi:chromate transporter